MFWRRNKIAVAKSQLVSDNRKLKKRVETLEAKANKDGLEIEKLKAHIKVVELERDKMRHVCNRDLERVKAERAIAQEVIGDENTK